MSLTSLISERSGNYILFLVCEFHQILSIFVLLHRFSYAQQLVFVDPAMLKGNLFEARYFLAGALLYHLDKCGGFAEALVGAGVEPCKAALHGLHPQSLLPEILLIDGRYLQFAACAGLDSLCNLHHVVGIEIESHHSVVALGLCGLLLD